MAVPIGYICPDRRKAHASCPRLSGTWRLDGHFQSMIVTDQEKAMHMRALAAQFRHAADETMWPPYRVKLLQVAQDLENEAEKLTVQQDRPAPSRGASRAG